MISILQPHIPHYREDFFKGLNDKDGVEIYCYEKKATAQGFNQSKFYHLYLKNITLGPFLIYSPFPLLKDKKQVVLMLHIGHITTWALLLTKILHKRKIILWGHGISVKRYIAEEKKPNTIMKLMVYLSDSIWLYTDKERKIWSSIFPKKKIIALNNTISDVERIILYKPKEKLVNLRKKYNITHEKCFIFCARFNTPYRRVDLLEDIIKKLDTESYGFIIIGEGKYKPNFSKYTNVYDFGSVYDSNIKDDLFSIAAMYIQPAWVGLSIVEALAYGLPIFTFKRSTEILQCVEYSYLIDGFNAVLSEDVDDFINKLALLPWHEIKGMGINANQYAQENLMINNMVLSAKETLVNP